MEQATKGQQINFYIDEVCPRGGDVLRLAYLFSLNRKAAFECVNETYERAIDQLDRLQSDNLSVFLAGTCWKSFREHSQRPIVDTTPTATSAAALELNERAALGLVDLFDLAPEKAAKILGLGTTEFSDSLTRAREKNEELARRDQGILQALHDLDLNAEEARELRLKISTEEIQKNLEVMKIEELTRQEGFKAQSRRWMILSLGVVVIFGIFYSYFHKEEIGFDPVQSLAHEALLLEKEQVGSRLLLPSSQREDVKQYMEQLPGFDFNPRLLNLGDAWELKGASVIDYELAKIAVVQFYETRRQENLFHFMFAGELSSLPPSEFGEEGGLRFLPYGSENQNLIIWQQDEKTLSMFVGHLSVAELAKLASGAM